MLLISDVGKWKNFRLFILIFVVIQIIKCVQFAACLLQDKQSA